MQPIRTFIAVNIAPSVATKVAQLVAELQSGPASVKWVKEGSLHVTLQFLGDVDMARIPEIAQAVKQAAAEVDPFEMICRGIGAFPNLERPRTLWIGVERGAEELCDVQRRIEARLSELGFRPEARKFHPHLTLGRVKHSRPRELAQMLEGRENFQAGATLVSEVVVYSSQLEREGPLHTALATSPLGP
jgi:2'-5' RNA ligase